MMKIAVIGLGGRAIGVLRIICKLAPEVKIVAVADQNLPEIPERLKKWFDLPADHVDPSLGVALHSAPVSLVWPVDAIATLIDHS